MRWILVIFCGCLTLHNGVAIAQESGTTMVIEPKAVIESAVNAGDLAFAVAAVGNAGGEIWSYASGHKDADKKRAASSNDIIQIASMTKLVTTIAALQLVERGALELDTPIDAYVPELAGLQVLNGFDANDGPLFEQASRAPTTRELMTHTAGYVYEIWNSNALRAANLGVTESAFGSGNFLASPLAFEPGTTWEYGISTDWLGALVERRSATRLANYFAKNIFQPLGMDDSHYELPEGKLHRTVTVMARAGDTLVPAPILQPQAMEAGSMAFYSGGGGLYSTLSDYGRVLQMLLNGGSLNGTTILKPETVDAMFRNHVGDIQPAALTTAMPSISNTADMSFGAPATFGLGLLIHPQGIPNGRRSNTGSWAGLFNSYYWVDRESGIYGIFGTQILPFYDSATIATLAQFERAVYSPKVRSKLTPSAK